jgi:YidC/Oxa1 family membrane protein insertase
MISEIFNSIVYKPLYNILVVLLAFIPGANVGYAIITLTILVRLVLFPFSHRSIVSQKKIQSLEGKLKEIKEKHSDRQDQAAKTMELYKEHGVNPFSGCLFLLVQLPIIFALYWVFSHGITSGSVDQALLYSFVHAPASISFHFLWFDLTQKSLLLALLAGATQYFQMRLALPPKTTTPQTKKGDGPIQFSEEFKNALAIQSRYVLPVMIFIFAWQFASAIALYWIVNNTFSIIHEYSVLQKAKKLALNT